MTITIIPFMPDGWDASAGGFPAMTGNVPFLRMQEGRSLRLVAILSVLTIDSSARTGTGSFCRMGSGDSCSFDAPRFR